MLREIVQLKLHHSPKFASLFNFLYKVFDEVDGHLRDMGCTVAWAPIQSVHVGERYSTEVSEYHPHLSMFLEMPGFQNFCIEVCSKPEGGFELEVEIFGKGWAVCGDVNSFQLACASLMAFNVD